MGNETMVLRGFHRFLWLLLLLAVQAGIAPVKASEGSAYKGWRVSAFRVHGLERRLAADLKKGLALAGQFRLYRRVYPDFYPDLLDRDLARAHLFLARRGYPQATIRPRYEADPRKRRVGIVFAIQPGNPVRVASVAVEGWPAALGSSPASLQGVQRGTIFTEAALQRATAGLETVLAQAGYAQASASAEVRRLDRENVAVRLVVSPGVEYHFTGTRVVGIRSDLVSLAQRSMAIRQGERYSPAVIERADESLRLLNLFRRIRLNPQEVGAGQLELQADLVERPPREIELGLGYWNDEFLRTHFRWEHRNLFRGGRGASVEMAYSRFLQNLALAAWWPALLGTRTRVVIQGDIESQVESSYELLARHAELAALYRASARTTLRAGVAVADIDVEVKSRAADAFVEKGGLLTVLKAKWVRDGSNDRLYPTRGTVTWWAVEWAPPGVLSGSHFIRAEVSGKAYLRMLRGLVWAARLDVGLASPLRGSADLLPNKRFFAGGAQSMRGYQRRKLGPRDEDGKPLGGEAKLEANSEFRFKLIWRFNGVAFVDVGQVWRKARHMRGGDLAVAIGPGLMLQTPVGPLRADLGILLTERGPRQSRTAFHLSVGQPF
jgi:outer membrane protein insertion porin family